MLPISASLQSSDTTTQTSGPAPQATAPVFSIVHQIGDGNSSNPTSSAAATASAGVPTGSVGATAGLPAWLVPAAVGIAAAALLGLLLVKRKAKP